MQNSNSTDQNHINNNGIIYEINDEAKTANVIDCDSEIKNIFIPLSIQCYQQEYVIIGINDFSFKEKQTIQSVQFPYDSQLQIIGKRSI